MAYGILYVQNNKMNLKNVTKIIILHIHIKNATLSDVNQLYFLEQK
jgi:hypothetical protein